MDGGDFDAVARALAGGLTRRAAARLLAGAGLGLTALGGLASAEAKKRRERRERRQRRKKLRGGRCRRKPVIASGGQCVETTGEFLATVCEFVFPFECVCALTTEGHRACVLFFDCSVANACDSTADCDDGAICIDVAGCDDPDGGFSCDQGVTGACAFICPDV